MRRSASARLDVHLIAMLCFDPALLAATCRVVDRARRRQDRENKHDNGDDGSRSNEDAENREKTERLVRLLRKVGHRGQFAARFRSSYSFDASVRAVMLREEPADATAAAAATSGSLHRSDALGALCSGDFHVSRQMRAATLFANGGSDGASAVTAALEATAVEADEHWSRSSVMRRMRAESRGRAGDDGGAKPVPVVVASGEFFSPSPSMAHASARQLRNHAAHAALVDTAATDARTSTRMPRRAPSRFSARVRLQISALNAAVEREQRDATMVAKKKPLQQ